MTAVRPGPAHDTRSARAFGAPAPGAPPTLPPPPAPPAATPPHTTGRHTRAGADAPSGPLVPLRIVVPEQAVVPGRPSPQEPAGRALVPGAAPASTALETATGRLVIDSSHSRLTPHLAARKVTVSVDGLPWRFAWGRTPIDLPAGRHLVEIEVEPGRTGRRGWGIVADAVPVAAGHTVEVFYRAPALPRLTGSLGPDRQPTAGSALCAGLLALGAAAALALAVLVLALLVG